jgi:hypothetical protein
MNMVSLKALPPDSRLWIFPSSTSLDEARQAQVARSLEQALAAWHAHGTPVQWGFGFVYDRFLLIAVNEAAAALTGCSIDQGVRALKALEQEHGLVLTDSHRILYRSGEDIVAVPRDEFAQRVERGEITLDTVVFDTVASVLEAFLSGAWEGPAKNAWHARAFPFHVAT